MQSEGATLSIALPSTQLEQLGSVFQTRNDADVRPDTAVLVTHGALLKSYDLNKKSLLPFAFLITPMGPQPSLVLQREPSRCRSCGAAFTYASAFGSFQQMRWQCAFCHTSNAFTAASYSPLPEYSSDISCTEYIESHISMNAPAVLCAPTIVFCVDGNLRPQEMLQVDFNHECRCINFTMLNCCIAAERCSPHCIAIAAPGLCGWLHCLRLQRSCVQAES